MEDFDDVDLKKIGFDFKNLAEGGVSWRTRVLLRFWPSKGVMLLAKEFGLDTEAMERADDLFL